LKPITFEVEGTNLTIDPRGYTLDFGDGNCFIGLSYVKGVEDEFRLGALFLKNFYAALDYENDFIIIGAKQDAKGGHATISGHINNPLEKETETAHTRPPPREEFNKTTIEDAESHFDDD